MVRESSWVFQFSRNDLLVEPVIRCMRSGHKYTVSFEPHGKSAFSPSDAERMFTCVPEFMARFGDVISGHNGCWSVTVSTDRLSQSLVYQLAELVEDINQF